MKSKIAKLLEDGEIDQSHAEQMQVTARSAMLNDFQSAYRAVLTWLEADMVNAHEIATGVGKLPDGDAYYRYMLANSTTTSLSPDEIHQLGLSEVARIHAEMELIKNQVGFEGSLQDFFVFVRDDEQFYYSNTDEGRQEYLSSAMEFLDAMKQKLPEFFGRLPKADLVVKRVESYREIEPMLYVDIRLKAPTPGGFIRRELSRQLNGEDRILLFCRSISHPFQ